MDGVVVVHSISALNGVLNTTHHQKEYAIDSLHTLSLSSHVCMLGSPVLTWLCVCSADLEGTERLSLSCAELGDAQIYCVTLAHLTVVLHTLSCAVTLCEVRASGSCSALLDQCPLHSPASRVSISTR